MMPPDLAQLPPDMSPPVVTGLPTDCTPGTTLVDLYNTVVAPRCIADGCHRNQFMLWGALTASQFRDAVVGVKATQAPSLLRVKSGDVNGSYLIYKLVNQQTKVAFSQVAGVQMPNGGMQLDHDSLCKFISWVQGGAN
jgi:hypothetical protein